MSRRQPLRNVINVAMMAWIWRALGALALFACMSVGAQAQQIFPIGSLQGDAQFGAYPQVTINCRSYTLGPGVRVLDPQQRIVLTAQLSGLKAPVVFQRDAAGNVFRLWLIGAAQAKQLAVPQAPTGCGLFGGG